MSTPTEHLGHEQPLFPPDPRPPRRSAGLLAGVIACLGVIALTVALIISGAFGARTTTTVVRSTPVAASGFNPAAIYAKVDPGVVDITSKSVSSAPQSPFGGLGGATQTDTGSGMVIDTQGHILTADHVVAGGKTITVTLPGGVDPHRRRSVAGDSGSDIAVLKINPAGLTLHPVTLGKPGQPSRRRPGGGRRGPVRRPAQPQHGRHLRPGPDDLRPGTGTRSRTRCRPTRP